MEIFERYIKGQSTDLERQEFEHKLATDSAFQHEFKVYQGLHQLYLRNKIEQSTKTRKKWEQYRIKKIIFGSILFAILVSIVLFYFMNNKKKIVLPKIEQSSPLNPPLAPKIDTLINTPNQNVQSNTKFIAKAVNPKIGDDVSHLRSGNESLDPDTKQIVDTLILLTRQTPFSDRNWEKAMQLFSDYKPLEAMPYILKFEKVNPDEALWLMAIANLEKGKSEQAALIMEKIGKKEGHKKQHLAKEFSK